MGKIICYSLIVFNPLTIQSLDFIYQIVHHFIVEQNAVQFHDNLDFYKESHVIIDMMQ